MEETVEEVKPFEQTLLEYREGSLTPELVSAFYKAFWEGKAKRAGIQITVKPFEGTKEELKEREESGDMVVYIPPEVARDRALLEKMFPQYAGHYALRPDLLYKDNSFKNNRVHEGYIYTESSIDAPFTGTTEDGLREEIEKRGREELNLTEYFVAAQASKLITGKFLDQGDTWVRLLGSSTRSGKVVNALFDPDDGRFDVFSDLGSQLHLDELGGRSVSVVK